MLELVRRSFGPLQLGSLPIGRVRELSTVELGALPHRRDAKGAAPGDADEGLPTDARRLRPVTDAPAPLAERTSTAAARTRAGRRRGLLGASIGLALREKGVDVVLDDVSPAALALAVDYGAGRRPADGDEPELIVVAVRRTWWQRWSR